MCQRVVCVGGCAQMDIPGSLEIPDIMTQVGLHTIEDKPWHIQYVTAMW